MSFTGTVSSDLEMHGKLVLGLELINDFSVLSKNNKLNGRE
jgi:hypothetical protein